MKTGSDSHNSRVGRSAPHRPGQCSKGPVQTGLTALVQLEFTILYFLIQSLFTFLVYKLLNLISQYHFHLLSHTRLVQLLLTIIYTIPVGLLFTIIYYSSIVIVYYHILFQYSYCLLSYTLPVPSISSMLCVSKTIVGIFYHCTVEHTLVKW